MIEVDEHDIDLDYIPNGILLCLRNSDRHKIDAEILAEKERFHAAIFSMFIALEEFSKALWLTDHMIQKKSMKYQDEKFKMFSSHKHKLTFFFDYIDSIKHYEKATGTNKTIGMIDEIQDEQDYKKRMLYVDYLNPNVKKSQYSDVQGWLNPLHIWMLNHVGEYDSMHALKTKFQELKQDFEFASNHFRSSELIKKLLKLHWNIPSPTKVGTFLQDHFQLKFVVTSIGVKGYDVEIQIRDNQSQAWINDRLIKTIQFDLKKYFICNNVLVELSTK